MAVKSNGSFQTFSHHYYTFGGKIYHQEEGGPIGLRGTCAIARLAMQIFELHIPCTRRSAVYENICSKCNIGAGSKEEVVGTDPEVPSIYVGETSRTIQERGEEHWAAARGSRKAREGTHIAKHQEQCHPGEEPEFILRAVGFYKTALSRQTAEAVRIGRRGGEGAVLNSRSEFNRCFIPRLQLIEEEKIKEMEQADMEQSQMTLEELLTLDSDWERSKAAKRAEGAKTALRSKEQANGKREGAALGQRRRTKKRKLELIGDGWGEQTLPTPPVGDHLSPIVDREQEEQPNQEGSHYLGAANSTNITEEWEQELSAPSTTVPHIAPGSRGRFSQPTHGKLLGEEVPPSPAGSYEIEPKILENDGNFEISPIIEDVNHGSFPTVCQANVNDVGLNIDECELNINECEQIECEEKVPSSCGNAKLDGEKLELTDEWSKLKIKCNINKNKWCDTHNIGTVKVPTLKKSWCWNNKKKEYCWKSQKINNYICKYRGREGAAPDISTENILHFWRTGR